MKPYLSRWRARLADPRLHELLWYCLPAVLLGLALRAWLTWALPYGFYHPDTHDFLVTPRELLAEGHLTVHGKTTFLTPALYTVPFLLKLKALIVIPLAQHARGLLLVLMAGALCRLWFTRWRWWVVPVTGLIAVQPAMLFWEHALMSESGFVFCAVGMALAGTLFARRPDWETAGCLLAAMVAVAGARPEGAILAGAGVLIAALATWGRWRAHAGMIAATVGVWGLMVGTMQTSHSGLLLYASLVHLTPDESRVVPGFGPYIRELRDERARVRAERVGHDVVRTGKKIALCLLAYAHDHPDVNLHLGKTRRRRDPGLGNPLERALKNGPNLSLLCRRLAREAALAHPGALPGVAVHKFLAMIQGDTGGQIDFRAFREKQAVSLAGKPDITRTLGRGLAGVPLDTPQEAKAFVDGHYDIARAAWFNAGADAWLRLVNAAHLPATQYSPVYRLPGLPLPFFLALLGAVASLGYPARFRRFQWGFLAALVGMWFVVGLAAEVIPRHRFVLEPFWILYFFAFCDALAALVQAGMSRACWWRQQTAATKNTSSAANPTT